MQTRSLTEIRVAGRRPRQNEMLFHALCLAFVGSCWGNVSGGAMAAPSLHELRQARWPQASMAAEVSPRAIPPSVVQQLLGQVQALRASQRAVCAAAKKGCGKQNIDIFTAIFAAGAGNKMPELLHELPFDVGPFLEWAREEGNRVYAPIDKVRVVRGLNSAEGAVRLPISRAGRRPWQCHALFPLGSLLCNRSCCNNFRT